MHKFCSLALVCLAGLAAPAFAQEPSAADQLINSTYDTLVGQAEPAAQPEAAPAAPAAPAGPTVTLPNGASSITENFSDWTLNCAVRDNTKICSIGQAQGNSQTGQQVLAVELRAPVDGASEGVLVLPFGLAVMEKVTLKIDDQVLGQGASFSTCIPTGCVVPLNLPKEALDALKTGKSLQITAPTLDTAQPTAEMAISLTGFAPAIERLAALAAD